MLFLMYYLLSGESLPVFNPPYYVLTEFIISLSCFIVIWVLVAMIYQVVYHRTIGIVEETSNRIEFTWTFIPSLIVFFLSYLNFSCFSPNLGVLGFAKAMIVGRQWYWSYGLPGVENCMYDSVMGDFVDSVDKPLRLEKGVSYCLYVTSADVIHSFSVPFLSIKVDAVPGRINQFYFIPDCCGRHVGYCSELCGAGHAYMPIVVEIVPLGGVAC